MPLWWSLQLHLNYDECSVAEKVLKLWRLWLEQWSDQLQGTVEVCLFQVESHTNHDEFGRTIEPVMRVARKPSKLWRGRQKAIETMIKYTVARNPLKEWSGHTVSREQLKFKQEELVQLYLVVISMGYHLKICSIGNGYKLNSIQFYQIWHCTQFNPP